MTRQIRGAVDRNRARRRVREAYRGARAAAPEAIDVVVIAKSVALRAVFASVVGDLRRALDAIPRPGPAA